MVNENMKSTTETTTATITTSMTPNIIHHFYGTVSSVERLRHIVRAYRRTLVTPLITTLPGYIDKSYRTYNRGHGRIVFETHWETLTSCNAMILQLQASHHWSRFSTQTDFLFTGSYILTPDIIEEYRSIYQLATSATSSASGRTQGSPARSASSASQHQSPQKLLSSPARRSTTTAANDDGGDGEEGTSFAASVERQIALSQSKRKPPKRLEGKWGDMVDNDDIDVGISAAMTGSSIASGKKGVKSSSSKKKLKQKNNAKNMNNVSRVAVALTDRFGDSDDDGDGDGAGGATPAVKSNENVMSPSTIRSPAVAALSSPTTLVMGRDGPQMLRSPPPAASTSTSTSTSSAIKVSPTSTIAHASTGTSGWNKRNGDGSTGTTSSATSPIATTSTTVASSLVIDDDDFPALGSPRTAASSSAAVALGGVTSSSPALSVSASVSSDLDPLLQSLEQEDDYLSPYAKKPPSPRSSSASVASSGKKKKKTTVTLQSFLKATASISPSSTSTSTSTSTSKTTRSGSGGSRKGSPRSVGSPVSVATSSPSPVVADSSSATKDKKATKQQPYFPALPSISSTNRSSPSSSTSSPSSSLSLSSPSSSSSARGGAVAVTEESPVKQMQTMTEKAESPSSATIPATTTSTGDVGNDDAEEVYEDDFEDNGLDLDLSFDSDF